MALLPHSPTLKKTLPSSQRLCSPTRQQLGFDGARCAGEPTHSHGSFIITTIATGKLMWRGLDELDELATLVTTSGYEPYRAHYTPFGLVVAPVRWYQGNPGYSAIMTSSPVLVDSESSGVWDYMG